MTRILKLFLAVSLLLGMLTSTALADSSSYPFDEYGMKTDRKASLANVQADWFEFDEKYDIALEKEWTVVFSDEVTIDKIDGMVIEKDGEFIPVKITLTEIDKATVAPVIPYESSSRYCLRMFLNNGNRYMLYFNTVAEGDNSRLNPAKIGEPQFITDNDDLYKVTMTELISGDSAWYMIKNAYDNNEPPKDGYEYILTKFKVDLISTEDNDSEYLSGLINRYDTFSLDGIEYQDMNYVHDIEPDFDIEVFPGATHEGWLVFEVQEDDSPVVRFGRKSSYGSDTESWFDLRSK